MGSSSTNPALETRRGSSKAGVPGAARAGGSADPGAQQEIGADGSSAALPGHPDSGSVFTAPETRGVLNTQLLKGWPCPCAASSSVTPARHPQPGTLGEGERLHTQFFFKRSHQENKKKTPKSQQRVMAQPLCWGCPAKPSVWDHPGTPQSQPQL